MRHWWVRLRNRSASCTRCEEIDTAAYAAKFCNLQTILPHYPDRGKRNKQAENAVRLSMSDAEGESTAGKCLVSCVRGSKDKSPGVAVSRNQWMAGPQGVECVTALCTRTPRSCQKVFAMCADTSSTKPCCSATGAMRSEVDSKSLPSRRRPNFRLLATEDGTHYDGDLNDNKYDR